MCCTDECAVQGELRSLATKVAKATATKVTHDIMSSRDIMTSRRGAGAAGSLHLVGGRSSALAQLEAADAQNAVRRYGP